MVPHSERIQAALKGPNYDATLVQAAATIAAGMGPHSAVAGTNISEKRRKWNDGHCAEAVRMAREIVRLCQVPPDGEME